MNLGTQTEDLRYIRIVDNPFVWNDNLRRQVINELYDRLLGYEYKPVKFNYKGMFYLDCGDEIEVENIDGTKYKTIVMNQYFEVPRNKKIINRKSSSNK